MAEGPDFNATAFTRDPLAVLRQLKAAFGSETTTRATNAQGRAGYAAMSVLGARPTRAEKEAATGLTMGTALPEPHHG